MLYGDGKVLTEKDLSVQGVEQYSETLLNVRQRRCAVNTHQDLERKTKFLTKLIGEL